MADTGIRILMLAPTPYFADRGCHVRIFEEAHVLRSLGHDVRIVTYHLGRDMPGIPVYRITRIPWYVKLEAGPSIHKLYLDLLLLFKAAIITADFRPDVIHAHLHEGALIGNLLKKMTGLPLLFDYQGSLTGECIDHGFFSGSSVMAALFRRIERMINRAADFIVTSSGAGAKTLIDDWGIDSSRVSPLIDGVDTDVFQPMPRSEARAALGIDLDVPVVAYLGLLNSYQGTDLLLDCIETIKSRGIKVLFLVMGFPEERYRQEAESRGLFDMIRFTGKVDYKEAPLMLSAADIAVTPKLSFTEANGKIFNYMACGLPVVCFDTPVNREALGDAGIYAVYEDKLDLTGKIMDLLADSDTHNNLSQQVRKKAEVDHSWLARGKKLVEIYRFMTRKNV